MYRHDYLKSQDKATRRPMRVVTMTTYSMHIHVQSVLVSVQHFPQLCSPNSQQVTCWFL